MNLYHVTDPATGQTLATYPAATDAEVSAALAAATTARETWGRATSATQRAEHLRQVARLHTERRDDLAAIIGREMGKSLDEALVEVDFCAEIYGYYAEQAEALLADEVVPLRSGGGTAVVRKSPVGVLLGIMPWNYPYYQVARFAAPNLLLGNTVLLKPAPQCPESAQALDRIFADAGLPSGAYATVLATDDQVAQLIADPRTGGVSLTGSERAGAAVAEVAGRHLKKVVLELGGSDPFVVLGTDDLDAAVEAAVAARLENAGQACNAAKRFVVTSPLYPAFVEKLTARLFEESAWLAPLSSERAAAALQAQLDRAVAQGATLSLAGERAGAQFPAGVLTGVTPEQDVYGEELFGPVAIVLEATSEDDAVRHANGTPFGLGSYLFTTDPEQAVRVADRLEAGMVFVNGVLLESAELPFGGVKRSGFGRELGRTGVDEFANRKLIRTAG